MAGPPRPPGAAPLDLRGGGQLEAGAAAAVLLLEPDEEPVDALVEESDEEPVEAPDVLEEASEELLVLRLSVR